MTADRPAFDLVVRGARIVSVHTGEVTPGDVAVRDGRIVSLRPLDAAAYDAAAELVDACGMYALPGFVDAHLHIESSFLTPAAFAPAVLARGTTTVAADPHEIANVGGVAGIRAMLRESAGLALDIFYLVPSCVPSVPGLETAGASIGPGDVRALLRHPRVLGLGEVMDYRGVVAGDARIAGVLAAARSAGRQLRIEGHAPGLRGSDLEAFMAAGVTTDHTKNALDVWREKIRLGMFAQIQAKAVSAELMAALASLPLPPPFALVTDDVAADALVREGHLDHVARLAIEAGLDPLLAVRALTLWPARHLGLVDRGALSPGLRADLVLTDDLRRLAPRVVVAAGRVVARDGRAVAGGRRRAGRWQAWRDSLRLGPAVPFAPAAFAWRLAPPGRAGIRRLPAMGWNGLDNHTEAVAVDLPVAADGSLDWIGRCLQVRMIERYTGRAGQAAGALVGLALDDAAIATTYSHDSHNLTVVGCSPEAMATAANAVVESGGGIAVARGDRVLARLPLPIAGILSDRPLAEVADRAAQVRAAMESVGWRHFNPFMNVATLGLLVSPARKLSDRGMVDVERRAPTPDDAAVALP